MCELFAQAQLVNIIYPSPFLKQLFAMTTIYTYFREISSSNLSHITDYGN
jgi:hypothetical protein